MKSLFEQWRGASGERHAGASARAQFADTMIFWLFVGGLAWVPLWYGSNTRLAWGINAILFPGLALAYEAAVVLAGGRHPVTLRAVALPAGLFAAVAAWIVVQDAPWIGASLANPIWNMTSQVLGRPLDGTISVDRDLTELALLRLLTAASVFWLALQLCRDATRAGRLVAAVAAISSGYALYGLIVATTGQLNWLAITIVNDLVSATFVNRNHFATYAGIGLIAVAGLLIQCDTRTAAGRSRPPQLGRFIGASGSASAILIAGGFLLPVALLWTGSRGGVLSTGAGILALGALALYGSHPGRRRLVSTILPLAGVLAVILLVVSGGALAKRLMERGLADVGRLAAYRLTARSILERPILGFGDGTFSDVFPMYRDRSLSVAGTWTQAHNTYLEVLQGLGLMLGIMLIAAVALLALRCAAGVLRQRQGAIAPIVALGATCLVGLHATVDSSLQTQAVALTFMAVLGAGVAHTTGSRPAGPAATELVIARGATVVMIAGLCGYTLLGGWNLVELGRAYPPPGAQGDNVRALIAEPFVAGSALDATFADMAGADDAAATRRRAELLGELLAVRPLSPIAWLALGGTRLVLKAPDAEILAALKMSATTGPNEEEVMWPRGIFGVVEWEALPTDFRQRTIADLAGPLIVDDVDDAAVDLAKAVLADKTPEIRTQIAAALRDEGVDATSLARLGLTAEPTANQ